MHCADRAWSRATPGLETLIENATGGIGVDAAIITAGTDSLDPINFAGSIARKRGIVVVVGDVPTGFNRNPHWYKKELQLRMSCSYGPGRYDPEYEEKGRDYPVAHVRWTEKRNMAAFQSMIHGGRISLDFLTTHEVAFEDAPKVYDRILNRTEPILGVVLRYDVARPFRRAPLRLSVAHGANKVGLAFIGAGNYAQSHLLPHLPRDSSIERIALMTQSGNSSRGAAERYGFQICSCREEDVFHHDRVNTVMIATRHDTHASYAMKALQEGKNVFVEKPLCVLPEELHEIEAAMTPASLKRFNSPPMLMVGFNRRFSPLAQQLKAGLGDAPVSMLYRINAGAIPRDHWIQDAEIGGGRIMGEACHFIDLLTYFAGCSPVRVFASAMADARGLDDTVSINLEFENGSVGVVMYCANGPKGMPKEYIEVFQAQQTSIIDDFKRLTIFGGRRLFKKRLLVQDKGQKTMVRGFLERATKGGAPLILHEEIFAVTRATFAVLDSLRCRRPVAISEI
jgi:polar amino acid transport system substrate-binding protein